MWSFRRNLTIRAETGVIMQEVSFLYEAVSLPFKIAARASSHFTLMTWFPPLTWASHSQHLKKYMKKIPRQLRGPLDCVILAISYKFSILPQEIAFTQIQQQTFGSKKYRKRSILGSKIQILANGLLWWKFSEMAVPITCRKQILGLPATTLRHVTDVRIPWSKEEKTDIWHYYCQIAHFLIRKIRYRLSYSRL